MSESDRNDEGEQSESQISPEQLLTDFVRLQIRQAEQFVAAAEGLRRFAVTPEMREDNAALTREANQFRDGVIGDLAELDQRVAYAARLREGLEIARTAGRADLVDEIEAEITSVEGWFAREVTRLGIEQPAADQELAADPSRDQSREINGPSTDPDSEGPEPQRDDPDDPNVQNPDDPGGGLQPRSPGRPHDPDPDPPESPQPEPPDPEDDPGLSLRDTAEENPSVWVQDICLR